MKKILLSLILVLLSSCSESKDEKIWTVGISADNPPYEFIQKGEIVGFDVDLINAIGKHLGKKIEFKNMEFHSLLAALATNKVDLVLAGLSITQERLQRVDFSIPYSSAKIAVLYRGEDNFTDAADLKGKKVGTQLGTIWGIIAHNLATKHGFNVVSLSNNLILVEELKSKRVDAIILEETQVENFINLYPSMGKFIEENFSSSFAIAMSKDSEHKNNINHAIRALKENGIIEKLEKKWKIIHAD